MIVMIKNVIYIGTDHDVLTPGKEYYVYNYMMKDGKHIGYYVINNYGVVCWYYKERFMNLKEYRKKKLIKLNY
jgi:hypothetical protein